MASQACSASANDLKGDPIILTAGLLISMGRQEATKPGRPCSPGPLMLSLLITNEKPHSLALHISNSSFAASIRLKCMAIAQSGVPQTAPGSTEGPPTCGRSLPAKVWERPEVRIRRLATPGVPTIATFSRHSGGRLTKQKHGPGANTHLGVPFSRQSSGTSRSSSGGPRCNPDRSRSSPDGSSFGSCPAPLARKFPRVSPRVSTSARIDRKKCPHWKAACPSRRFLTACCVWQRSVRSQSNLSSGVWCWIYQTLH